MLRKFEVLECSVENLCAKQTDEQISSEAAYEFHYPVFILEDSVEDADFQSKTTIT